MEPASSHTFRWLVFAKMFYQSVSQKSAQTRSGHLDGFAQSERSCVTSSVTREDRPALDALCPPPKTATSMILMSGFACSSRFYKWHPAAWTLTSGLACSHRVRGSLYLQHVAADRLFTLLRNIPWCERTAVFIYHLCGCWASGGFHARALTNAAT